MLTSRATSPSPSPSNKQNPSFRRKPESKPLNIQPQSILSPPENPFVALLAAVAQGLLEFLPVSSSGHLALLGRVSDFEQSFFTIALLHVATSLAAVVYHRRAYWQLIAGLSRPGAERRFALRYAAAQTATAAVAIPLALALTQTVAAHWRLSLWTIGAMLLLNAMILVTAPRRAAPDHPATLPALTWPSALWVGLAQGIAALPGLSRSGLTIAVGLRAGLSRKDAASLSFLLAPPVILASAVFWASQAWQSPSTHVSLQSAAMAAVMLALAFVIALCVMCWVMAWVRAGRLWWFALWSAAVGVAALIAAAS